MNHTQDTFIQTTHGHTLENALKEASNPNGYAMPLADSGSTVSFFHSSGGALMQSSSRIANCFVTQQGPYDIMSASNPGVSNEKDPFTEYLRYTHFSVMTGDLDRTTPQKLQHTYSQLSIMLGLEQGDFSTLNSQPAPYHPPQMEVAPTLSGPDRRRSRKPRRVPIYKFKDGGSRSAHIHPTVPNNTVGGSDILQTTVPDITCEILLLAKEGETERSPCDVALQWDYGWLYRHFGEHQAKGELNFSLSGCPFTLLPGAKPCRTRKGHPVELSVYTRHVELQHFVNVPRFACDYCDQTFSRPDQVPRHWKEPDSTCGPDKVTVNEHSSVWPQVLTETQWSHEQ